MDLSKIMDIATDLIHTSPFLCRAICGVILLLFFTAGITILVVHHLRSHVADLSERLIVGTIGPIDLSVVPFKVFVSLRKAMLSDDPVVFVRFPSNRTSQALRWCDYVIGIENDPKSVKLDQKLIVELSAFAEGVKNDKTKRIE